MNTQKELLPKKKNIKLKEITVTNSSELEIESFLEKMPIGTLATQRSRELVVNKQKDKNLILYEPTVLVTTKKCGNHVIINITDSGKLISQKIIDKIFQPFFHRKTNRTVNRFGFELSYYKIAWR